MASDFAQPARAPGYRPVYENLSGISLYSAIVPVPPRVKKNRAENMPLLLAQRLGRILHIPAIQPLCLTRQVLPQKSLDQQKRFANVKDAYACRTGVDLSGMRLLLLDDVITTGATISACAKALLEGGAVSVDGVCCSDGTDAQKPRCRRNTKRKQITFICRMVDGNSQ